MPAPDQPLEEGAEPEMDYWLRLISTDGHRLTLIERHLAESGQFPMDKGILIPRKGMAEVIRFLAEEEKVSLGLGKQSLALKADDRYLFIRLLTDKKFPDYRRIIPDGADSFNNGYLQFLSPKPFQLTGFQECLLERFDEGPVSHGTHGVSGKFALFNVCAGKEGNKRLVESLVPQHTDSWDYLEKILDIS